MNRDAITVERFYTGHSARLDLKLLGGAAGLKRVIREPTVNRPGSRWPGTQNTSRANECRSWGTRR